MDVCCVDGIAHCYYRHNAYYYRQVWMRWRFLWVFMLMLVYSEQSCFYSLILAGRKDLQCLFVVHRGWQSRLLTEFSRAVTFSCSGWEALSRIDESFATFLLSPTPSNGSSLLDRARSFHNLVQFFFLFCHYNAARWCSDTTREL